MKLYYGQAMEFHGDSAVKHLDFEYYDPVKDINEPCMFWCYFPEDYEFLLAHKGKKYMFWHNSDVGRMIHMKELWPYLSRIRMGVTHICHNALLHEELAMIGIYSLIRPTFWGDVSKYKPCYKYSDKPDVYITSHVGRETEYGEGYMFALAMAFPDLKFHIYGSYNAEMDEEESAMLIDTPDNLIYHGQVSEDVMDKETAKMQICLRPNRHDGVSQTAMKAILRGQYLITGIDYEGIPYAKDFRDLYNRIEWYCGYKTPTDNYQYTYDGDEYDPEYWREQFNNFDYLK